MSLQTISNIITVFLYLHNSRIIYSDEFDFNWAKNINKDIKITSLETFGNLRYINTFHVLEANIAKMRLIQNQEVQVKYNDLVENDTSKLDIV